MARLTDFIQLETVQGTAVSTPHHTLIPRLPLHQPTTTNTATTNLPGNGPPKTHPPTSRLPYRYLHRLRPPYPQLHQLLTPFPHSTRSRTQYQPLSPIHSHRPAHLHNPTLTSTPHTQYLQHNATTTHPRTTPTTQYNPHNINTTRPQTNTTRPHRPFLQIRRNHTR